MSKRVGSDIERLWIWMTISLIDFESLLKFIILFQSRSKSDPTLFDIDCKNKIALVWTTLYEIIWNPYFFPKFTINPKSSHRSQENIKTDLGPSNQLTIQNPNKNIKTKYKELQFTLKKRLHLAVMFIWVFPQSVPQMLRLPRARTPSAFSFHFACIYNLIYTFHEINRKL